jgi:hypothetical protein
MAVTAVGSRLVLTGGWSAGTFPCSGIRFRSAEAPSLLQYDQFVHQGFTTLLFTQFFFVEGHCRRVYYHLLFGDGGFEIALVSHNHSAKDLTARQFC